MRMHVRNQTKVATVSGFHEYGHTGDEANHGAQIVWIQDANYDGKNACDNANEVNPHLLRPQRTVGYLRSSSACEIGVAGYSVLTL